MQLADALIAATAVEHGLAIVTRDDDYDQMARAYPVCKYCASDDYCGCGTILM